ncbi:LysE family translocator [Bradyrhizobium lablabi]|uniref:LysE family translocator n=1 Tax=Bradyrhizobium lablabi TaxID=722472 RepID=UPI001BADFABA|nr:LysE family translocator [Bradyrhizobium lablabi]MBR1126170.1 LysE family translocator [Bradyrhizobium lablabi]
MTDINPLLAFALTSLIIEITPGPNMTYLAALSLSGGMRTGFAAVAGIAIGLMTYGIIAALGLAAVIDNSPLLYGTLRWAGVAYLLWLAWEAWSSERETSPEKAESTDIPPWVAFRRGLITNLLNPKAAVFYVAILPEFIQPAGRSVAAQTLSLSFIYVAIATAIHAGIVVLAGSLQSTIIGGNRRRLVRRGLAVALVFIAIWFALTTGQS